MWDELKIKVASDKQCHVAEKITLLAARGRVSSTLLRKKWLELLNFFICSEPLQGVILFSIMCSVYLNGAV